jgi:hypothetical protein
LRAGHRHDRDQADRDRGLLAAKAPSSTSPGTSRRVAIAAGLVGALSRIGLALDCTQMAGGREPA